MRRLTLGEAILFLRLRLALGRMAHELARSRVCERWAEEAMGRAAGHQSEAAALAARLGFRPTR